MQRPGQSWSWLEVGPEPQVHWRRLQGLRGTQVRERLSLACTLWRRWVENSPSQLLRKETVSEWLWLVPALGQAGTVPPRNKWGLLGAMFQAGEQHPGSGAAARPASPAPAGGSVTMAAAWDLLTQLHPCHEPSESTALSHFADGETEAQSRCCPQAAGLEELRLRGRVGCGSRPPCAGHAALHPLP